MIVYIPKNNLTVKDDKGGIHNFAAGVRYNAEQIKGFDPTNFSAMTPEEADLLDAKKGIKKAPEVQSAPAGAPSNTPEGAEEVL